MLRTFLAGALALFPVVMPATAQVGAIREPPAVQPDATTIGFPIFSSDGKKLGRIVQVGVADDGPVLLAEIERPLGLGSIIVAVPTTMIERRTNRIKLTITALQVRDKLNGRRR